MTYTIAVLLSGCILLVECALRMGEVSWLAAVAVWSAAFAIVLGKRPASILPLAVGALVIALSLNGYKVYGRMSVYPIQPTLEDSLAFDHLEWPNVVVATDGTRHTIPGIEFDRDRVDASMLLHDTMLGPGGDELRFTSALDSPSGYVGERRFGRQCGNVMADVPEFFPPRHPNYTKDDLAIFLSRVCIEPPEASP